MIIDIYSGKHDIEIEYSGHKFTVDIINTLGYANEDSEIINDDFFVERHFGNKITRHEIKTASIDNIYDGTFEFKFYFTIHKNHITLDNIDKRILYYQFGNICSYLEKLIPTDDSWIIHEMSGLVFDVNKGSYYGTNIFILGQGQWFYPSECNPEKIMKLVEILNKNSVTVEDNQGHGTDICISGKNICGTGYIDLDSGWKLNENILFIKDIN